MKRIAEGIYLNREKGTFEVWFGGEWVYTAKTFDEADSVLSDYYCNTEETDDYEWEPEDFEWEVEE